MHVEHLIFTTLRGGQAHGLPILELRVGDSSHPSLSNKKLRKEIVKAAESLKLKLNRIQLAFTHNEETDPDEVRELMEVLHDNNFFIGVEVGGDKKPAFLSKANHVRTYIYEQEWLNFITHELFYAPAPKDAFAEPELSQTNKQKALKYILIEEKVDPNKLFSFLRESRSLWNVLYPNLRTYQIPFIGGKK
jgi:hypothetical protein